MIRVHKPAQPPAILLARAQDETDSLCRERGQGRDEFNFNKDLYGHREVKDALRQAQHDKCAFCESYLSHVAYGDVEHFRPKAALRQNREDPLTKPAYYWLAYCWSNLYFSCQLCNQRFKRNWFPLSNPSQRVRSHRG